MNPFKQTSNLYKTSTHYNPSTLYQTSTLTTPVYTYTYYYWQYFDNTASYGSQCFWHEYSPSRHQILQDSGQDMVSLCEKILSLLKDYVKCISSNITHRKQTSTIYQISTLWETSPRILTVIKINKNSKKQQSSCFAEVAPLFVHFMSQ